MLGGITPLLCSWGCALNSDGTPHGRDARMPDSRGPDPFLLSTAPPSRAEKWLAGAGLATLVLALLITIPYARLRTTGTEVLLPAYAVAVFLVELLTSTLLLALFSVQKSWAVLTLSSGYLFSGLLVIPWVVTLPDVFAPLGMGSNIESTATLAAVRRLSFPLFVIAYALTKDRDSTGDEPQRSIPMIIVRRTALIASLAGAVAWVAIVHPDKLPKFMIDNRNVAPLWHAVPIAAICLYLIGLVSLWVRRRSSLDLWLMVVLCTLLIENITLTYVTGGTRLNLGWWAGRLYGLVSASIVLLVLLSEATTLQARLARSVHSERLARESRLTTMEALSASIAHEINQPLASIVINAGAGLRWLDQEVSQTEEVRAALERIARDGHRARDVVDGIRRLFRRDAQERVPLDLNHLIEDVLQHWREEARMAGVTIRADLDAKLPRATGNPSQLQQVISNLIANAGEAMGTISDRPRVVHVTSKRLKSRGILVSVADTGPGIEPNFKDRIFEPFFSTKPDGMGMGLMFSRSIIESHGGKLWVTDNVPHGAVFHLTLPNGDGSLEPNVGPLQRHGTIP
ncbi:MASE4 domain-containing protein (plasmid) [Microvirga terrae]|uniref:histidine kinase n=1 Tax=Microvirga terrae TaxID=2740529 RepID=A0ABY5RZ41_9HYPH|nr:MASE4 domain-containing protein [Microvirga terrae]UVF22516.1 MASE4 domain-containing protein [Microvirga terrae]